MTAALVTGAKTLNRTDAYEALRGLVETVIVLSRGLSVELRVQAHPLCYPRRMWQGPGRPNPAGRGN